MTSTAASDTTLQTGQTKNLVLALLGFTITFWAWNIIAPLGVRYSAELGLSATQASFLGRHAGTCRLPRTGAGRSPHRPLWRPTDVHGAHPGLGSSGTAGCLRGITEVVPAASGVRLLPWRCRHHVRGRHPFRQRLVRTGAARLCDRGLRRWHGRYRLVGVLHSAAGTEHRLRPDASAHCDSPGRRWRSSSGC